MRKLITLALCSALMSFVGYVCVTAFLSGCGSGQKVVGTTDKLPPGYEDQVACQMCKDLSEFLCAHYVQCGTVRIVTEPVPGPTVVVAVQTHDGLLDLAPRRDNRWGDCDPLTDVYCWLDHTYSIPRWVCSFGDCPKPPVGGD